MRETLMALVAALVLFIALFCSAAEVETYTTPTGVCNVFPQFSIDAQHTVVVCTSDVPDMTGDQLSEMEVRILELRRYGRLACATHVLFDPTCPDGGSCHRYLSVGRQCF